MYCGTYTVYCTFIAQLSYNLYYFNADQPATKRSTKWPNGIGAKPQNISQSECRILSHSGRAFLGVVCFRGRDDKDRYWLYQRYLHPHCVTDSIHTSPRPAWKQLSDVRSVNVGATQI